MHGVRRSRQTAEAIEARKRRERAKLQEYLDLTESVLTSKKCKQWNEDALNGTTRLLTMNPEFYTIWNYRRDIYVRGFFSTMSPDQIMKVLSEDLLLTFSFLRQHPKVYWIWNHRRWCLENVPENPTGGDTLAWKKAVWDAELSAVEKMLNTDARNFHAWGYRQYVLASMPLKKPEIEELKYTTGKIESSFSNFSAWHQRSKIYGSLWEKGELDKAKSRDDEFEFVKQAMYVDPNDQSAWMYHRWLVGDGSDRDILEREISVIEELLELEPDSKWCLESLIHYKRLLVKEHQSDPQSSDQRRASLASCMEMLRKLSRVDPQRSNRYTDIERSIQV